MSYGRLFMEIKLEGSGVISGESTVIGYENLIELTDFDFGLQPQEQSVNKHSGASGGQGSKLQPKRVGLKLPDGLTVNKRFDASSTKLMSAVKTRARIERGRILVAQGFTKDPTRKGTRDAFYIEFTGGKIVDVKLSMSASGKTMELTEEFTIEVEKLRVFVNPVDANGAYGASAKPSNLIDVSDKTHQGNGGR